MSRILCAMSGGVDSSVAAALLSRAGHDVIGVFLRLGSGDPDVGSSSKACCSVNDAQDAARVADRLGIPFYALNYRNRFETIIEYFVDEYNRGRTPNPCARCNQWLKFGSLLEHAEALGCELLATGHYARINRARIDRARIDRARGNPELARGKDRQKDQSYFLFSMPRGSLDVTLFPVGEHTKEEIRALARDLELPVADKRDSQEICFVPGNDYRRVLEERSPETIRRGAFVDGEGKEIGEHPGHQHFTVGQRRGIGQAFGEPRYVVAIDAAENKVTLGTRQDLGCETFDVAELNWLSVDEPAPGEVLEADVQIRYRSRPTPARLVVTEPGRGRVELAEPQDAVTPGQAAVLYRGDVVLAGGWIE